MARGVLADARCRERLDAMLARVETAQALEVLDDGDFERALAELGPRQGRPRVGLEARGRPKALVAFGMLGPGRDPTSRAGGAEDEIFPGYSWRELRDGREQAAEHGVRCQTAIEIQSAVGCPFDCAYCPYGSFVSLRLDVEHIVERVTALVRGHPDQTLWKLNNRSDTLGLEPEYGLARALVERFAELDGPTLMLYSKGDAVEHLTGLAHGGRTVACFTLTPDRVAALVEAGAPGPQARIAALGALDRAGYPTRVRLSPVVPLVGWPEAYAELVERVAEAGAPELVTLWTLSMIDFAELGAIVPLERLYPEVLAEARAAADTLRGDKGAPFPPATRARIYRELIATVRARLPRARVSLCLESPAVWDTVGALRSLGGGAGFVCNCGPRVTPEALRLVELGRPRRRARRDRLPGW
ncbi:MAG: hypothetical protein IT373_30540 [Polyangiaceae bacterium]|nr:hypothetical protein [Polyangiaceae bacterium]